MHTVGVHGSDAGHLHERMLQYVVNRSIVRRLPPESGWARNAGGASSYTEGCAVEQAAAQIEFVGDLDGTARGLIDLDCNVLNDSVLRVYVNKG